MSAERANPHAASQSSDGWTIAWLLALLGVALAWRYLVRPNGAPEESLRPAGSRGIHQDALDEGDRGRAATAASAIPPRGWKDRLLRIYASVFRHRVMALAAGMTYYSILAIFPALAALVALYGLFADPSTIARHLDQLGGFVPGGAIEVARDQLTRVASKGSHTLGLTFLIGLAISLWSANAAMTSLFDTLNVVYGEEEKRGYIKLYAISLCFTIAAILFVLAALASIVAVPVILNEVGLSNVGDLSLRVGRWPAMCLVVTFALAIIYRYGPSREVPRWRWVTWGSAVAALLWLGVSALFSWYAANFGSFNETYGSLGAIIGFMTWLWISAIVILLGAEIDAELEHQRVRDAATGGPQSMGLRGAQMAR